MITRVYSAALRGVEAVEVEVEVSSAGAQTPGVVIVGLPDAAVRESSQRVTSALGNSALAWQNGINTVNLAPADLRKEGPAFDLPIAVAMASVGERTPIQAVEETMILGELALDGGLRPVRGVLPVALEARRRGRRRLVVPVANAPEAAVVDGLDVIGVHSLMQAWRFLTGEESLAPFQLDRRAWFDAHRNHDVDFDDVKGQHHVKRALEVAVAGAHNLLIVFHFKSSRLSAAWSAKRQRAGDEKLTSLCPSWLELAADRKCFTVLKDRVAVVRRIYEMAAEGHGQRAIARTLNAGNVPTLRGAKRWHMSSVKKILDSRVATSAPQLPKRENPELVAALKRLDEIEARIPRLVEFIATGFSESVDVKLRELEAEKSAIEKDIVMLRAEELAGAAKTDEIDWNDTEQLKQNIRAVVRKIIVHPAERWFRVELFDGREVRCAEKDGEAVIDSAEEPVADLAKAG